MKFGVSQPVRRKEDARFLKGTGSYIDDDTPEGSAHAAFFRSPVAHGRITNLDVADARAMPGVLAVITAADFDGKMPNKMDFEVIDNRDGTKGAGPLRPILARDRVCYAGEAIAVVVAETRAAALDAVDAIVCDFDDLPAHVATATGGPAIHEEAPDNLAYDWAHGDEAATAAAFDGAAHTSRLELIDNRVMGMSMEPRGCFAEWTGGKLHVSLFRPGRLAAEGRARVEVRPRRRSRCARRRRTSAAASASRGSTTPSTSPWPSRRASSAGRCAGCRRAARRC